MTFFESTFVSSALGSHGGGVTKNFWVGHYPFLGNKDKAKRVTCIDTPGGKSNTTNLSFETKKICILFDFVTHHKFVSEYIYLFVFCKC